jgi:uncharacterized protein with GYD domain
MVLMIALGRFTQEGMTKIKESPKRLEAARKVAKSVGGELKAFYYTMGRYDFVAIIEGPSNEAAMQALLTVSSVGAVRMEAMVAVPSEKAAAEILNKLP